MTNTLHGRCHCGAVTFALDTERGVATLGPRTCQCGLCLAHGASWTSDPAGALVIAGAAHARAYQFGHKTSDFLFCRHCGVLLAAVCNVNGALRAVVNLRAMPGHDFTAPEALTDFEGEGAESRLERRTRNWTGAVRLEGGTPENFTQV